MASYAVVEVGSVNVPQVGLQFTSPPPLTAMAEPATLCVVRNVPPALHAADLRRFFAHHADRHGFACFHYRHRPEVLRGKR